MTRTVQLAAIISLSTLALAGCGGGAPDPTQTTSAATSTSKQSLAPPINSPVSADAFKTRPCDLLTPAQRETVGATRAPETEDSVLGPACTWHAKDVTEDVEVAATLYTKPEAVKWERFFELKDQNPFFEPAGELAGTPAVHTHDEKKAERGGCTTQLGLNKDLMMDVSVNLPPRSPDYKTPCKVSDRMATFVIQNLRAGG
ncbi:MULTISPECIES: DUF3558 domain-containing protein [unclassified Crossiella]|uniref:DUF3558 domain-containing protein n=1 Tax=unclassified Crossiella TaxID=2620835 RepID=UPI001FFFF88D|nr:MULTISPECIES: DUF3558 domain-containing protein [unclassified Crossiella]MCK2243445.1 DUF3558 domain-containing protein [Crossiella sp. S99.2]MCK2257303.1 DUF3558 domain-containing protein [Crossiella sp. S99.1]